MEVSLEYRNESATARQHVNERNSSRAKDGGTRTGCMEGSRWRCLDIWVLRGVLRLELQWRRHPKNEQEKGAVQVLVSAALTGKYGRSEGQKWANLYEAHVTCKKQTI